MKTTTNLVALAALLVLLATSFRTLSSSLAVAGCGVYSHGTQEVKETYDRQLRQLMQQFSNQEKALQRNITTLLNELEIMKREKDAQPVVSKEVPVRSLEKALQSNITSLLNELEVLKRGKDARSSSKEESARNLEDGKQAAAIVPQVVEQKSYNIEKDPNTAAAQHPCINSDFTPPKHSIAMATFVTDMGDSNYRTKPRADYTYGAAALVKSIQKYVGHDRVDLILLEIPTRRLPDADRAYLAELGWNICTVTPIEALYKPFGRFIDQFNKFHLWNFVAYDKLLYLDSDALVVGNIDPLLERNLGATKRIGVTRDYFGVKFVDKFNMGVFLIHPNRTEYERLVELQATNAIKYTTHQAEQGFLNELYKDEWEEIGIEYNANMAVWAQKRSAWPADPKILHVTLEKPWQDKAPEHRVKSAEPLEVFLNIWIEAAREYGVLWNETAVAEAILAESNRPKAKRVAARIVKRAAAKTTNNSKGIAKAVPVPEPKRAHSCTNTDFHYTHDRAVFTLLIPKDEKYITAARVLGTSVAMQHSKDVKIDLVILELSTNPISPSHWEQLRRAGWTHKCTIEPVKPKHRPSPRFIDQFSKLRAWGMTAYKVVVYLDADTFVLGNIDKLLTTELGPQHKIGVTADFRMDYGPAKKGGEWAESFNMGVFLIHPNWSEYQRLIKLQEDGTVTDYEKIMAEQGWLNTVYKESWKDIGMIYNANVAARNEESFKAQVDDIRIVHYTTMKPWFNNHDPLYDKLCKPWADIQAKLV